jgi:glycine dehydrogenase subunit 1
MSAGGGLGGFIASRDEEKYVSEYPLRLISITDTIVPGEYGFGQAAYHRTSYMSREKAKDWVGTTAALHGIIAAVYLSVMGPEGLKEVGETILQKSHYTARKLEKLEGVDVRFSNFFKEFPLTVDSSNKSIRDINQKLLKKRIIGGKDISKEFPELGESALLCITELHSKDDIDRLVNTLNEVIN